MTLMKRLMWPRRGEEVTIFQHGKLFVDGHVSYSGEDSITVLGRDGVTATIDAQALSEGIEDGSIVVKKKGWMLNSEK